MSNAFLYRMGVGYAGQVTRLEVAKIEPQILDSVNKPTVFGVPVIITSGKVCKFAGSGTIKGFLVRPYPTQAEVSEALDAGTPNVNQMGDILRSGYMIVDVQSGTAEKGGIVYANDTTGLVQADSSGATDTGAKFMGAADENGIAEIEFNV